jgi:hypothetical protein
MGNFTPKPIIQHRNKKFISNLEKFVFEICENELKPQTKNKYKKLKIKNKAPNCVQKNIK